MTKVRTVAAVPRAASIMEGLRDVGYSLDSALADILDNSISANAEQVEIVSDFFGESPALGIVDDGTGMAEGELFDAMFLGSEDPLEERPPDDLGRFGLGLKTASFSQCTKLTVLSRKEGVSSAACWDLARVRAKNDWRFEVPEEHSSIPFSGLLGKQGTLVVWENIDRLLGPSPDEASRVSANQTLDQALQQLELVFHRFLDGSHKARRVKITANGRELRGIDPFNSRHPATVSSPVEHFSHNSQRITIQAFTLPHHSKVSNAEWEKYALPGGYVRSQGFYVYRINRLIIYGTWFSLARQVEITKLSRVCIDIPNSLDREWKIDMKKASAQLPQVVRSRLRSLIPSLSGPSKRVYTHKGSVVQSKNPLPIWDRLQKDGKIRFSLNRDHPVIKAALTDPNEGTVARALAVSEAGLPLDGLLADLSDEPEKVECAPVESAVVKKTGMMVAAGLRELGQSTEQIERVLRMSEPYRSYPELIAEVLAADEKGGPK